MITHFDRDHYNLLDKVFTNAADLPGVSIQRLCFKFLAAFLLIIDSFHWYCLKLT